MDDFEKYLESALGPSPWYGPTFPDVKAGKKTYTWRLYKEKNAAENSAVLSEGETGAPVLALGMYMRPFLANPGFLGIWYPDNEKKILHIDFLETAKFVPMENFAQKAAPMEGDEPCYITEVPAIEKITIPQELPQGEHKTAISNCADSMKELLLLAKGPDAGSAAVSIYVWHPAAGKLKVYPQAWFNSETHDLSWEWVTRVVRHPQTGLLLGDGMRIAPFRLKADHVTLE